MKILRYLSFLRSQIQVDLSPESRPANRQPRLFLNGRFISLRETDRKNSN